MTLIELPDLIQGKDVARFRKFVPTTEPDECWEWQSTRNHRGYGKFWLDGRTDLAHRVSYRIHKGAIPAGLHVRHTCDNPPCVNPSHLLVGTRKENARDALDRDRYRRGSGNHKAKLTAEQVAEIKEIWLRGGETQLAIALRYGVSRTAVQWILNGRNWAGIGEAS